MGDDEETRKEVLDEVDDEHVPFLKDPELKPYQRLLTSKSAYNRSLWALRLCVLADSINSTILKPNYPFIVTPGAHPDSFDSTGPFDFGAAQYFVPMTTLVGTAIAATFIGGLSDKLGRRPLMLICVGFGVIGSIAKYFARGSFWAFCAVNFITGLFGATLALALATASDVAYTRAEKDTLIGSLVGLYMVGNTGGGVISIAMENTGLFAPLFVGAALNLVVTIFSYFFLIEPNKMLHMGAVLLDDDDDDDKGPETIDWKVTSNILVGSLADNAGSVGLFPLCLSPLAFNVFYTSFLAAGLDPLMTANAFKWISTLIALMIIPAAMSSNKVYEWIGAAGGCVAGNFFTAIMTIAMLQIVLITPTNSTYAGFVTLLYAGFPFTMISQLSTGPMLDMMAPADKRGLTQGLNQTVMSLGSAVFPWVFGILADEIGTETTIWITVGVSLSAVLINSPLLFEKGLKRKKAVPDYSRHIKGHEDKDIVERALAGEWVPAKSLREINIQRVKTGHHFLAIPNRTFEEDKPILHDIKKNDQEDFAVFKSDIAAFIGSADMSDMETRRQIAEKVKKARISDEERELFSKGMGSWFADYLVSAGYRVEETPIMFKQMIMRAFPVISKDQDVTADNVEQVLLNFAKVVDGYLEDEEAPGHIKAWARAYV